MALMTRMARLFRADLHAVLDRIEEPEILLRQALREMEECIDSDRRRLALLARQREALLGRSAGIERAIGEVGAQLEACLEAGNDDLARTLLRRRLEAQRQLAAARRRRDALDVQRDALSHRAQEHEARLRAMREHYEVLAAERAPHEERSSSEHAEGAITDHDVEIALLREKQARGRT